MLIIALCNAKLFIIVALQILINGESLRFSSKVAKSLVIATLSFGLPQASTSLADSTFTGSIDNNINYIRLGMSQFQQGRVSDSIVSYNNAEMLQPSISNFLWQRGISQYFARDYRSCFNQFTNDVKYNPRDTEEIIWAMMCDTRLTSGDVIAAQSRMMSTPSPDPRRYMARINDLFRGSISLPSFRQDIDNVDEKSADYFYGSLYLSLFEDLVGDLDSAAHDISRALSSFYAMKYKNSDFMISVAEQLSISINADRQLNSIHK